MLKQNKKPSVTQIVAEMFPTDPLMFQQALSAEGLARKREKLELISGWIAEQVTHLHAPDVMFLLSSFWSIMHNIAFDRGLLGIQYKSHAKILERHVAWLERFFQETWAKLIMWETTVETDDYTGTCDWVLQWNGKNYLIDWKTWTAYKYIYWIENKILKKNWEPYSRKPDVDKVSFQLSLYRVPLEKRIRIDGMLVIWITEQWVFYWTCEYNLDLFHEWKRRRSWLTL